MTGTTDDLILRPITGPDELDLIHRHPYVLNEEVAGDLEAGRRRPEWLWMALDSGRLVARVAWWKPPHDTNPAVLDILDLDDTDKSAVDIATRLVSTAMEHVLPNGVRRPGYVRFLPPDWHDDEAQRRLVANRTTVLERTGAHLLVERLRLQWNAGTPIAPPSGRLTFTPADDVDELIRLMTLVLDGTLDAHSRAELAGKPPAVVAAEQYDDELANYTTPREWWRIGRLPDGEPVGFVISARNPYNPIIAYIGVVPAHRGRRYIDDLLNEGTRILADEGVERIRAATDVGNTPMAAAFARAGYVTFERQLDMTWA